ncbi:MAG: hypothetical protein QOH96_1606 [Blastocatellia bacterium]|jgi:hypothetical protein|nr:hypothetical protein [Blastocatellia bacterium]
MAIFVHPHQRTKLIQFIVAVFRAFVSKAIELMIYLPRLWPRIPDEELVSVKHCNQAHKPITAAKGSALISWPDSRRGYESIPD